MQTAEPSTATLLASELLADLDTATAASLPQPLTSSTILHHNSFFWLFSPKRWLPLTNDDMVSWAIQRLQARGYLSLTVRDVSDAVRFLRANTKISADVLPPCWVGPALSDPQFTLSLPSGLLDLGNAYEDNPLNLPRTPAYFDPVTLPFTYDPGARCPRWTTFLTEVSGGDPDFITCLQNFFGYCLLPCNSIERILFLHGKARSGKSTITDILTQLLGRHNCASSTLSSIVSAHGTEPLLNKRAIFFSESVSSKIDDGSRASSLLKQIVGRDFLHINPKGVAAFSTQLSAKLIIVSNDIPSFDDSNRGMTSKLVILPFLRSFEGVEDVTLRDTLRDELPGIFAWALEGALRCVDAVRSGTTHALFPQPAAAREISEAITREGNPIREFASDCLVSSPSSRISTSDLYTHYTTWASNNCLPTLNPIAFGKALTREQIGRHIRLSGGRSGRIGVALRSSVTPVPCSPGVESGTMPSEARNV